MSLKEYATADGSAIASESNGSMTDPDFYSLDRVKARIAQAQADDIDTALHGHSPSTIIQIPLRDVQPSPFNARRSFDAQADAELDDSVRQVGIMQPVLVRPVRLPIDPAVIGHYELVFGHRRYHSAARLDLVSLPAMVHELTDEQASAMQAIENLQRQDITVMEEALGYADYLKRHHITKDQLAEQIGKSRTYVYNRLKLATLCPAAARALEENKIKPEVATLIARVPAALQDKALTLISTNHPGRHGDPAPFRWVRDQLLENFSLDLKEAIFSTDDAKLVPAAGGCDTCEKRSGCAPEIYGDVVEKANWTHHWMADKKGSANICMDPVCFASKKKAHLAVEAKKLEGDGKTVVTGNAAKAALSASGEVKGGYVALKDVRKALGQIEAKDRPKVVTIQDPKSGKTFEAVKRHEIAGFGADLAAQVAKPKTSTMDTYAEQRKKDMAEAERQTADNKALLLSVRAAAATQPRGELDLRLITRAMLANAQDDDTDLVVELRGFGDLEELGAAVETMNVDQIALLLLDLALVQGVDVDSYSVRMTLRPTILLAAAAHYGVQVGLGTVGEEPGGEA